MRTKRNYPKSTYLGTNNGERIYLTAPSWDCGWYWGFGYLGNKNCHYHVDSMEKETPFHEAFEKHFGNSFIIKPSDRWTFTELFKTFYLLKQSAEMYCTGGAHISNNPCKDIIINKSEESRINKEVLPAVFDEIYKILERNVNNNALFNKLFNLYLKGNTSLVIDFMFDNKITPEDIKTFEKFTKTDFNHIHGEYWKEHHANRKNK